jgi:hypothetical protein
MKRQGDASKFVAAQHNIFRHRQIERFSPLFGRKNLLPERKKLNASALLEKMHFGLRNYGFLHFPDQISDIFLGVQPGLFRFAFHINTFSVFLISVA